MVNLLLAPIFIISTSAQMQTALFALYWRKLLSTCCGIVKKITLLWIDLLSRLGISLSFMQTLHIGQWLLSSPSPWTKALIAMVVWLIWKARCNLIFKTWNPHLNTIISRAWSLCSDFFNASSKITRESSSLLLTTNSILIFSDASRVESSGDSGLGFLVVSHSGFILLASCDHAYLDSPLQAELAAILLALRLCVNSSWSPDWIFTDCPRITKILKDFNPCVAW